MEVIDLCHDEVLSLNQEYVAAIGNFDGIHQGHREVIRKAVKIAKEMNLKPSVMCFDIVPKQLINNIDNYYVLKSFEQKCQILKSLGVEVIFLIKFDDKLKNMSPDEFVKKMIIENNISYLVCGFDFSFGKNKEGNLNFLQKFNEFKTIILPRFDMNNDKVSSTLIHELLSYGDIERANALLVRPYSIIGEVVKGNQKGKPMGFPTANTLPSVNYRIPQSGVYATKVIVDGKEYQGMTNIGHNPTFNFSSNTSIETNIFDFDEDIYGKTIEVIFIKYLRRERIFESVTDLVQQLNEDKQCIIKYFKNN